MQINKKDIILAEASEVYRIVKEQMSELSEYLPSVSKIEKVSQESISEIRTQIVNHWYANVELPVLLQKFLNPQLLSWQDTAVWDDEAMKVEYQLQSFLANDLFEARGCNQFVHISSDKMELYMECSVTLHAANIPGVPKLLAGKVTPALEKVVESMLAPNLSSLGLGIKEYLKNQKS